MFFRCSVPKLTVAMVPALLSDSQENNWRMNSARGQGHSVTRRSAQRFTVMLMGAASPFNRRQRNPNMHETGSCDPVKSQEYSGQTMSVLILATAFDVGTLGPLATL